MGVNRAAELLPDSLGVHLLRQAGKTSRAGSNSSNGAELKGVAVQKEEGLAELLVFIIDESYPPEVGIDEDESEITGRMSSLYKREIEEQFEASFDEVNVGPGADLPAFVTVITEYAVAALPWILAVFFSGRPIVDNLDAWPLLYERVSRFFRRPVLLNRHGAAVLAVQAVFDEIGGSPKSIRLLSYKKKYHEEAEDILTLSELSEEIEEPSLTFNLSTVVHLFEIEADGSLFRVTVNGRDTRIAMLSPR